MKRNGLDLNFIRIAIGQIKLTKLILIDNLLANFDNTDVRIQQPTSMINYIY
jgi:hypothetical protein